MLRVLDRYLLREVIHGWLAITLVLWFVIITNRMVRYLAQAAAGELPGLWPLFLGNVNGSLGETSALACILGGLYLCLRRSAAWEIPLSVVAGAQLLLDTSTLSVLSWYQGLPALGRWNAPAGPSGDQSGNQS